MKLIFIGTGSAFTVGEDNFQSNMLLVHPDGAKLLIDCGTDARAALHACGYTHRDINDVYISHLHSDHCGGLEWLGFSTYFDESAAKVNLHIRDVLVDDLWNKRLAAGMRSIKEFVATLDTFFNVAKVDERNRFAWQGIHFETVPTLHILSGGKRVPSFGVFFAINAIKVFITTDTQFAPSELRPFYDRADVIFHDCETGFKKSNVHAHYDDLVTLDDVTKAKMWLYHYNPGSLPNAKSKGFRGFVKRGQAFDFDDVQTFD